MQKLKQSEVPMVRDKLAAKQGYVCPLCLGSLKQKDPVLDHCHTTGSVRATLCRNCNGMEGKVKTAATRAATGAGAVEWLENLAAYWRYYKDHPRPFLYPSHKSDDEKRIARNTKARTSRAKAKGKV
jgi:hypothetical protein